MVSEAERPAALSGLAPERITEVDVRAALRAGQEPFGAIMAARKQLPPDGVLRLRAIFEPVPLYAVLRKQGLEHWTEQLASDDWVVWFYPAAPDANAASPGAGPAVEEGADDVVVLDVRGLEPPEPLLRTLAALEELPRGGTLVQVNERVPQFLLPQLRSRGFEWQTVEEAGVVRVFIKRSTTAG